MELRFEHRQRILEPWCPQHHADGSGVLVAVVGQDRATLTTIDTVVRDLGYRVISFRAPASAIGIVEARPDVVVAEPVLPCMRTASDVARPAVVLVTDTPQAITMADRCCIDAVACKPVIGGDLAGAIARARSRRRIARRRKSPWGGN